MPLHLYASLLGGVAFTVNGRPITSLPARVGQALLVYMLHQPRPVARERLMDLFFQTNDPKQARINLRATLSRIRKQIGDVLDANRAEVWVRDDITLTSDAATFTQRLTDHRTANTEYEHALRLYEGDFLAGFYLRDAPEFEQWMVMERERLRLLAIEGLQRLIRWQKEAGAFREALASADRLLAIEPLLEQTQRDKMLLLTRTGQRALALRHYRAVITLFNEELGVALAPETVALYERIEQTVMPPPLVLPTNRRAFVGRSAELTLLQQTLADRNRRLVTLHGTGGVGKTRLSQEVARRTHSTTPGMFLDGVYFVELAAVDSAEAAAVQIAQVIRLPLRGQQSAIDQITQFLKPKEMLLILDNFEQLVAVAADLIARLLQVAPAITLLVTSRERLNLYAESVLDVGGLSLPQGGSTTGDAVRLFIENAGQHRLGFAPDPTERAEMARICQLLEGVPLGIELAAGWLRQQSLSEVAAQIMDSLAFLETSLRDVPERQRSLRAVFLHSWELLTDELQRVLSALAVFPGSFSAEAARSVLNVSIDQIAALSDKSLLQQTADNRFTLHPLIREFAYEQLAQDGPRTADLRAAHSDYFLTLLHQLTPALRGEQQEAARASITQELDNVRRAWRSASSVATINDAIVPTFYYYDRQNYFSEARSLFADAARRVEAITSSSPASQPAPPQVTTYGTLLSRQAWFTFRLGKLEEAIAVMQSAVPVLEQGDNEIRLAQALCDLATFCRYTGDISQLEEAHSRAYSLYEKHDDVHGMLVIRTVQTYIARDAGRLDEAREKALGALAIADPVIYSQQTNNLLKVLGSIAYHAGKSAEATHYGRQALAHAIEHDNKMGEIESRYLLAQAALGGDDLAEAEAQISRCYDKLLPLNAPLKMASLQLLWAEICQRQNDVGGWRNCLIETAAQLRGLTAVPLRLRWLAGCAELARAVGEVNSAEQWTQAGALDPRSPTQIKSQINVTTQFSDLPPIETLFASARNWLLSRVE